MLTKVDRGARARRHPSGPPDLDPSRHYARWFAQLFSQTSDAVFVVGREFVVLWWGPRAEQLLGIPAEQTIGRRCYEVVAGRHEGGRAECGPRCWVMQATRRGRPVPAFCLQLGPRGADLRPYTVGFMSDDGGVVLVHVLRPRELGRPSALARSPACAGAESESDPLAQLTRREREVLRSLLRGETSREVAARLSISYATARNHVQNVLMKLGVHSRLHAAILALHAGVEAQQLDPPESG